MLATIRTKIRALIEDMDLLKSETEAFTYSTSSIFTLAEDNVESVYKVSKNGVELNTGDYDFDSTTNELTISASLSSGDIITVRYYYYKYSNTELNEFVRASLVWISIFAHYEDDYELENEDIYPTPDNKTTDLVAIISSILINPDYTSYKLPNVTVVYNGRLTKEEKIKRLINRFSMGIGVNDVLKFY